jgi:hypothetical protein
MDLSSKGGSPASVSMIVVALGVLSALFRLASYVFLRWVSVSIYPFNSLELPTEMLKYADGLTRD